jgi:hypothetical protein
MRQNHLQGHGRALARPFGSSILCEMCPRLATLPAVERLPAIATRRREYLAVLESQRVLFAARDQLSQYKLARLQALLGLCKALGCGWRYPTPSQKPL